MKKRGERKMGERRRGGDGRKAKMEWPPIKPKSNLNITRLKGTDLFTVQNFFTSVESKAFINAAESIGFVHQGGLGPTKGEAYRDNDRISVNDPVLAGKRLASVLDGILMKVLILEQESVPIILF
ncbi:uncharacterized protein LOC130774820 [Actinidia eriantha]|uniref:uncharacterized protein LOC130774820 n=1 Tax=Actinidia eriantha TaxID=165200 RepID=UPI00258C8ADF|nr:uncharacterized protein LOC130774820 [Actinidia eriantha]